jgi:uncharacterized protein (TIGR02453 family)
MTPAFTGFPDEAITFYEGLEADNSKPYWTDHKSVYERSVQAPMQALLAALGPEFGEPHLFRPYRDVRFARDKSPYKTACGGTAGGEEGGAYYVQFSARGLLVGAGYWRTAADQVERLRTAVADDRTGPELEGIIEVLRKDGFDIHGDQLKTRPRGFPPDHPRVDLLRHKTLTAGREWPPEEWLGSAECLDVVAGGWRALSPLNHWLETNVGATKLPLDRRR